MILSYRFEFAHVGTAIFHHAILGHLSIRFRVSSRATTLADASYVGVVIVARTIQVLRQ